MQSETIEEMDSVEVAKQTMIGDLVQAALDELKAAPNVWQKMSQAKQDEVIERLTHRVVHNVTQAIHIIASDDRPVIRAALEQITVKNGVKAVLQLSKKDPAFHDLADATGEEVLIVLPHVEEYANQETGIAGEPDQNDIFSGPDVPIEDSLDAMEDERRVDAENFGEQYEDPLLEEAIAHVVSEQRASISNVQRKLKIGYNRAAHLIDRMEQLGVISEAGGNGTRFVYQKPGNAEGVVGDGSKDLPEGFSGVVEKISWVGVFGKAMLDKYDGPQARAIEKALIDEGIIGKEHYQGAHMVLIDNPDNVEKTSLKAAEEFVIKTGDASAAALDTFTGLSRNENELILSALEAKGIVTKPDAKGERELIESWK